MIKYSGNCLCNKVKLEIKAEPVRFLHCYCKDCQRWTGCSYEPAMVFKSVDVIMTGNIQFFEKQADSGHIVSRGFCPNCGGAVLNKNNSLSDFVIVYAGILDQKLPPLTAEIYAERKIDDDTNKSLDVYQGYFKKKLA
ncbi:GFA family protein [Thiotrichales bacterium 19X7-9]|nr:GFA family protein [Thiotrichales bacterium 19X7-9]